MRSQLDTLWPFKYKAAIFDFDGTIGDSGAVWDKVDKIFLEKRGIAWTPEFAENLAALGFKEGAQFVIEKYKLNSTAEEICEEWNNLASNMYRTQVNLRPGAEKYIRSLKEAGYPVALATTNDKAVISALRPRIDVWELFDAVVFGAEVPRAKNHPDIYLEAARRLGVDPCGCIVFEDIPEGLTSATKAGMTPCAVRSFEATQNLLAIKKAGDFLLEDWSSIPC